VTAAASALAALVGWTGVGTPNGSNGAATGGDPNVYAASLDTEVTYDNSLAQGYDDGYGPRAFAQFEAALAPYGAWIDDPALGRVWVPSLAIVGVDFAPYATNGFWVLTEYGWTWRSGWEWGWAPFHYGRWAMRGACQWCWIPGTLWGPAWVSWRQGRDYVGWAPLPPRGIRLGRPIGPRSPWRFITNANLGAPLLSLVPLRTVPSIFGRTAAVSRGRLLSDGGLSVKVPIGPPAGPGGPADDPSLATSAPGARPRLTIKPRRGAPVDSRPWVAARAREQTPVLRWPPAGRS
jgi:hypothetical protein